jgi:hypothetical protein
MVERLALTTNRGCKMSQAQTKAVQEYPTINGKLTPRWFPMVLGMAHNSTIPMFVVPRNWVNVHCPDGFENPLAAHAAAREFLGI